MSDTAVPAPSSLALSLLRLGCLGVATLAGRDISGSGVCRGRLSSWPAPGRSAAHATTNALLAGYVLATGAWAFWS